MIHQCVIAKTGTSISVKKYSSPGLRMHNQPNFPQVVDLNLEKHPVYFPATKPGIIQNRPCIPNALQNWNETAQN
jgi:hypothetical protein